MNFGNNGTQPKRACNNKQWTPPDSTSASDSPSRLRSRSVNGTSSEDQQMPGLQTRPSSAQQQDSLTYDTPFDIDTCMFMNLEGSEFFDLGDNLTPDKTSYLVDPALDSQFLSSSSHLSTSDANFLTDPAHLSNGTTMPPRPAPTRTLSDGAAFPDKSGIGEHLSMGLMRECNCLSNLVELLEKLGVQQVDSGGVDIQLLCLGSAVRTCQETISCGRCSTDSQNSILLATIAQSLVTIAEEIGRLCLGQPREVVPSRAEPLGWENGSTGEVLDGAIWVGRYRIESSEKRFKLVQELGAMHLTELRQLLHLMKNKLASNRLALQQVAAAEETASRICLAIRGTSEGR